MHGISCNDLPACHDDDEDEDADGVVFVDDDTDTVTAPDLESLSNRIQFEANKSADWISDNQLCVSGEKSKLMVIANKSLRNSKIPHQISINIQGKEVMESTNERLLGIVMNNSFSWKPHLYGDGNNKGLVPQLSQRVGILKKLSHKMSKARLQVFSEGIFYSKIKYCMQVYGNVFNLERYKETGSRYSSFTVSANSDLQILQNKLNRIIINSRGTRAMSTRELCEMTKTLSVQQMIAVSTLP